MRVTELKNQFVDCLTSDLDPEAKVVWCYLVAWKARGVGTNTLEERLPRVDVAAAIETLKEAGKVKRSKGVWAPVFVSQEKVAGWNQRDVRDERALQKFETYQMLRSRDGYEPVIDDAKNREHFRRLSTWLDERGIKFKAYLRFAIGRTEHMRDRMAYPTPPLLAGTWLRDEWTSGVKNGDGKSTNGTKHAGKSYDTPEGLRELLVEHGFGRAELWSDAQIRHVHQFAENMVHFPDHFPEPDRDYGPEIEWLKGRMETKC